MSLEITRKAELERSLLQLQTVSNEYRDDLKHLGSEFIYNVSNYVKAGVDIEKAIKLTDEFGDRMIPFVSNFIE